MNVKRAILGLILLAGGVFAPSEGTAQTSQIRLVNWGNAGTINTTEYGVVTASPYQGYFAGDPTNPLIDFFCIDFEHYAPPLNYNYNVRITSLGTGDVSLTRHGSETGALAKYRQIAWLIGQRPQVSANDWRAIQLAVWQTFSGSCSDTSRPSYACARYADVGLNSLAANWRTAAASNAAQGDYQYFYVATGYGTDGSRQEYMYVVTPEPQTYALMGVGLMTLLFAWRRRRRREDEPGFGTAFGGI